MHPSLKNWLDSYLSLNKVKLTNFQALNGDAGFRQYYRLNILDSNNQNKNYILVYAPPSSEKNQEFLNIQKIFAANNIRVPSIYNVDINQGFFILEDLGEKLLYNYIKHTKDIYKFVLDKLLLIQQVKEYNDIADYSSNLMQRELYLCNEWFLNNFLEINQLDKNLAENLNIIESYKSIINNLQKQPQVLVHRDYQSKNMILSNELDNISIIDFQDALIGPVSYDLASVLFDCYVDIDSDKFKNNLDYFYNKLKNNKIISNEISLDIFTNWFYHAVLLRHIKNLGIFARLYLRDNKKNYLQHMPRTLSYVIQALDYLKTNKELEYLDTIFNKKLLNFLNNKLEQVL
tara:strand:+ start:4106 stop:5143 length:1038 start_codon:yes stop_codon:yes gene_type:complete